MALGDPNDDLLDPAVAEATGLAPGASDVVSVTPHDVDPAYSMVEYADGRKETMPTSEASALPQAQPQIGPPPPMGPPPPPVGAGNPDAAEPPPGDPTRDAWLAQQQAAGFHGETPGNPFPRDVSRYKPPGAPDSTLELAPGDGPGTLPSAQPDPNAPVAPGDAPTVAGGKYSTGVTENETVADPGALMENTLGTADEVAGALDEQARGAQVATSVQNQAELEANEARQQQVQDDLHKAQIHTEEAQKVVDAIEATPIEEDFYKDAPGRQVAAWVALALSGFLSGSTQGANPAMAQMMQALQHAQDRFIDNQKASKTSKLALRTKQLGDAKVAEASMRMQMGKLFDDHAKIQAKQFGLDALPPAVSTVGAKMRVDAAQQANVVGMHVKRTTDERFERERQPAAPTNQAEQQLQGILGPQYAKKHQEATDPKGTNLPGILTGAQRAEQIKSRLDQLAAKHGGSLPGEGVTGTFGASTSAKVFGDQASKDVLEAQSLKEELKLAFKQSSTTSKYFDSEKEGQGLNDILNTGNWETSSKAVSSYVQRAKQAALSIADGVAPGRGPQYLQYLQGASTERASAPTPKRSTGFKVEGASPAATPTGEAPAPRPLPTAGSTPPQTGSRPGTYVRQHKSRP